MCSKRKLFLTFLKGHRCSHCHEREDGFGVRGSNSWHTGIHVNFHVSFFHTSELILDAEYISLATRPDAQFLHLVMELLQLLDKSHSSTHFRFSTLLIAPVNSRSVAVKFLSGCLMKKPNSNKRFSIGGTRMRRLTTNISLATFQILSKKPTGTGNSNTSLTPCRPSSQESPHSHHSESKKNRRTQRERDFL